MLNETAVMRADAGSLSGPVGLYRPLHDLLHFWNTRREGRVMPARADLLPETMRPWMGHLVMMRVVWQPRLRFLITLYGQVVTSYSGGDFTNRYLDDSVPANALKAVLAPYLLCAETGCPAYDVISRGRLKDIYHHMHRLALPLANADGEFDRILVGVYAEGEPSPFIEPTSSFALGLWRHSRQATRVIDPDRL